MAMNNLLDTIFFEPKFFESHLIVISFLQMKTNNLVVFLKTYIPKEH